MVLDYWEMHSPVPSRQGARLTSIPEIFDNNLTRCRRGFFNGRTSMNCQLPTTAKLKIIKHNLPVITGEGTVLWLGTSGHPTDLFSYHTYGHRSAYIIFICIARFFFSNYIYGGSYSRVPHQQLIAITKPLPSVSKTSNQMRITLHVAREDKSAQRQLQSKLNLSFSRIINRPVHRPDLYAGDLRHARVAPKIAKILMNHIRKR